MRTVWSVLILCFCAFALCQVHQDVTWNSGVARVSAAQWKDVAGAFRSRDGKRIAALIEPEAGLLVRSANGDGHPTKHVTPKDVISYFQRLRASHDDPRAAGPLGFATILPKKMPKPDSRGRYTFDSGHESNRDDDSYVRFAYHNGKLWLVELTGWSEEGRMP